MKRIALPHDFIIKKPRRADAAGGAANGYFGEGQGNYKRELEVPAEWQGKTVLLDVDGAYMNAEVMLNNQPSTRWYSGGSAGKGEYKYAD